MKRRLMLKREEVIFAEICQDKPRFAEICRDVLRKSGGARLREAVSGQGVAITLVATGCDGVCGWMGVAV